jgi:hypothetical protein
MHNRFILFAIGGEVMGNGWGLSQTKEGTRSIPVSYVREKDYLLKSCPNLDGKRQGKELSFSGNYFP